jgi:hypothetical protein
MSGLCNGCHAWAHAHPSAFKKHLVYLFGAMGYARLQALSWTVVPDFDFKAKRDELKDVLSKIKY